MPRIHVIGAAGSGTTTLGVALAGRLRLPHFDSDDYYWIPTVPLYRTKRNKAVRDARMTDDLAAFDDWVWSGSAVSWNVDFERIDLAIFLTVPAELRLERLRVREIEDHRHLPFVSEEEKEREIREFLEWAALYEDGGIEVRSRRMHEKWLGERSCPVLRIDGDTTTAERVRRVLDALP